MAFRSPETQERVRRRPFHARIGANEKSFGPSPRAVAAMAAAAAETWKYNPENYDLKQGPQPFRRQSHRPNHGAGDHDPGHVAWAHGQVEPARKRIGAIALSHGLTPLPSATNFVTLDCGADGGFARGVLTELIARDAFVRMPSVAPLDRAIRIGCGCPDELDVLERELPAALRAARGG